MSSKEDIEVYYNKVKDNYPDIDKDLFINICKYPWKYLKKEMAKETLYDIRIKYIGCFQVYPGRAKLMLDFNKKRLDNNHITELEYNRYKNMLENHLKRLQDEGKD